mmetsp:Transcript_54829/g.174218  ORF Transcript_54829/g.174218 Transcript_54829/m.174218 type:complete len:222 (-) Transcript_54829:363-1028(-)
MSRMWGVERIPACSGCSLECKRMKYTRQKWPSGILEGTRRRRRCSRAGTPARAASVCSLCASESSKGPASARGKSIQVWGCWAISDAKPRTLSVKPTTKAGSSSLLLSTSLFSSAGSSTGRRVNAIRESSVANVSLKTLMSILAPARAPRLPGAAVPGEDSAGGSCAGVAHMPFPPRRRLVRPASPEAMVSPSSAMSPLMPAPGVPGDGVWSSPSAAPLAP